MKRQRNVKIRRQLYGVYALTLLIPLAVIGLMLIFSARKTLNNYYIQLLESDNSRVKALLGEITMQAHEVSDQICFDDTVQGALTQEYADSSEFLAAVNHYNDLEVLTYNSLEIAKVYIYTDNPTIKDYRQFRRVTEEVAMSEWYQKSKSTSNAFWTHIPVESITGTSDNLCMVRRVNLPQSDYHAVAVVQISDSYIRSRMGSGSIIDMVSVDDQGIVYGSSTSRYGEPLPVQVDHTRPYFRSSGVTKVDGKRYFYAVSTINLYMTNSKMHVCTLDSTGITDIQYITMTWLMVLALALLVPLVLVTAYAGHFAGRVNLLREEMHKASLQDYNIIADFSGSDELTEAFEDLKVMVRDIKEKDARMYEAELNEQELLNKQQLMEYKMLSSQINPHYLYNTLETIRMKSLSAGNREVADAIKLLGKTLHYIQENTGNAFTTLQKELDHVQSYLAIQRLRFGERINYRLEIQPGIRPEELTILPLMLQPVVENAVVHGLETVEGVGYVTIEIFRHEDMLHIHVLDNGAGMTQEQVKEIMDGINAPQMPQSSIALYNIHQRIRLRYGEGYGVKVESQPGRGTRVCLRIPA